MEVWKATSATSTEDLIMLSEYQDSRRRVDGKQREKMQAHLQYLSLSWKWLFHTSSPYLKVALSLLNIVLLMTNHNTILMSIYLIHTILAIFSEISYDHNIITFCSFWAYSWYSTWFCSISKGGTTDSYESLKQMNPYFLRDWSSMLHLGYMSRIH